MFRLVGVMHESVGAPVKRLYSLDALRGVAALAVVVWHWQHFLALGGNWTPEGRLSQPFYAVLKPLYVQGWAAVDLFFVLSGFVFFWLYADAIRTHAIGGLRFAALRFSRLYPLHIVLLIVVAVLQYRFFKTHGVFFIYQANDWQHFLAQIFMVQNWWPRAEQSFDGPSWSVSIEVLLYLLFFIACRAGMKRKLHILAAALVGALLMPFDEHIGRGVAGFFMGGFAFAVWEHLRDDPRARTISRGLSIAVAAGWVLLFALIYGDSHWIADGEANDKFLFVFDYLLCPATVLVLGLREYLHGAHPRPLGRLGDISYATYMLQFPLQLLLANIAASAGWSPGNFMSPFALIAFYAGLIALGFLSYRYFERPMQALIRGTRRSRFASQPDQPI